MTQDTIEQICGAGLALLPSAHEILTAAGTDPHAPAGKSGLTMQELYAVMLAVQKAKGGPFTEDDLGPPCHYLAICKGLYLAMACGDLEGTFVRTAKGDMALAAMSPDAPAWFPSVGLDEGGGSDGG